MTNGESLKTKFHGINRKVDSHAKCNDGFLEDFAWRSVIQPLAGSIIQTMGDDVQLGLGE